MAAKVTEHFLACCNARRIGTFQPRLENTVRPPVIRSYWEKRRLPTKATEHRTAVILSYREKRRLPAKATEHRTAVILSYREKRRLPAKATELFREDMVLYFSKSICGKVNANVLAGI